VTHIELEFWGTAWGPRTYGMIDFWELDQ